MVDNDKFRTLNFEGREKGGEPEERRGVGVVLFASGFL